MYESQVATEERQRGWYYEAPIQSLFSLVCQQSPNFVQGQYTQLKHNFPAFFIAKGNLLLDKEIQVEIVNWNLQESVLK